MFFVDLFVVLTGAFMAGQREGGYAKGGSRLGSFAIGSHTMSTALLPLAEATPPMSRPGTGTN